MVVTLNINNRLLAPKTKSKRWNRTTKTNYCSKRCCKLWNAHKYQLRRLFNPEIKEWPPLFITIAVLVGQIQSKVCLDQVLFPRLEVTKKELRLALGQQV